MTRATLDELLKEVHLAKSDISPTTEVESRLRDLVDSRQLSVVDLNDLGCRLLTDHAHRLAHVFFDLAARDPRAIGARINRGRCDIQLGRLAEAEAGARSLLDENVSFGPAWQLLGQVLLARKRPHEAVDALRRAASLIPGDARVHWQLARACEGINALEEALAAYKCSYERHPHDSHCLSSLLRLKRTLSDWDGLDALSQQLVGQVSEGSAGISPFYFLIEGAGADMELACARLQAPKRHLLPSHHEATDKPRPEGSRAHLQALILLG